MNELSLYSFFFESITWDEGEVGFEQVPGGEDYTNRSVLAWHFYIPPLVWTIDGNSRGGGGEYSRRVGGDGLLLSFTLCFPLSLTTRSLLLRETKTWRDSNAAVGTFATYVPLDATFLFCTYAGFLSEFSINDYSTMEEADRHLTVSQQSNFALQQTYSFVRAHILTPLNPHYG